MKMPFKLPFSYEMLACATLLRHSHSIEIHASKPGHEFEKNPLVVCPQVVKSNYHLHVTNKIRRDEQNWWKLEQTYQKT